MAALRGRNGRNFLCVGCSPPSAAGGGLSTLEEAKGEEEGGALGCAGGSRGSCGCALSFRGRLFVAGGVDGMGIDEDSGKMGFGASASALKGRRPPGIALEHRTA